MTDERSIALVWLSEMETCVRAVDFERCRAIFAPEVVGFGTRAAAVVGLDRLERDQWRHIWSGIRNFTFVREQMHCRRTGDGLWIACPWTSDRVSPEGHVDHRPGRMTAVLELRNGHWLAVHTHHSLVPNAS